jgi:LuxR family maltose regulon positive regulatory protein
MRHRGDIDSLILEAHDSVQYVTEYLFSEILSQQPSAIRQCLLNVSILDRFCAPLIEALLEPDGEQGEEKLNPWDLIEVLQEQNMFIIRLDAKNQWFRFHHLFRDLLQNQLERHRSREVVVKLHSRASVWFAENGWVEEAIRHALKAGDTLSATQIVGRNRQAILNEDKCHILEKWLTVMPEEIKQESVDLLLAQVWVLLHHLAIYALPPILEKIEKIADRETIDISSRGEIDFFRGYACYLQGQGLQSEEYLRKALERIPETYYLARGQAIVYHALALQMIGRKEMAVQGLNDKLRASRSSKGITITRLLGALGFIHLLDCNISQSLVAMQRAQEIASRHDIFYAESWALYVEALIHFLRNELDDALPDFSRILENPYIVHTAVAVDSFCALAQIYQIRQQPDKAQETLKLLLDFAAQTGDPGFIAISLSCQAHLSMLRGDMAQALLWLRSADLIPDASIMLFWVEVPRITKCRVLIADGSDASLQEALDTLHKYKHENKALHNTIQQIGILALMATGYKKQGRIDEALATLGHAIELAEPGGVIRPFIEPGPEMADLVKRLIKKNVATNFVGQILTAFREEHLRAAYPVSSIAQPLVDPLTKREMEILNLLAKRERRKKIAETLFISPETVKRHTTNIYQKLGVNNQEEAVAKAKALGILSPQ